MTGPCHHRTRITSVGARPHATPPPPGTRAMPPGAILVTCDSCIGIRVEIPHDGTDYKAKHAQANRVAQAHADGQTDFTHILAAPRAHDGDATSVTDYVDSICSVPPGLLTLALQAQPAHGGLNRIAMRAVLAAVLPAHQRLLAYSAPGAQT